MNTATITDIIQNNLLELQHGLEAYISAEEIRPFASGKEAWAELKLQLEAAKTAITKINDLHKDLWTAVKENNETAYSVTANEISKTAAVLAGQFYNTSVSAKIAARYMED